MSRSTIRSAVPTNCISTPIAMVPITSAITSFIGTPCAKSELLLSPLFTLDQQIEV
jgi:hypothetical protein